MVTNRLSADVLIIDPETMEILFTFPLTWDEQPTMATDYVEYYQGRLYVAFRGPKPLSALKVSCQNNFLLPFLL
jgi:hypothetical protein